VGPIRKIRNVFCHVLHLIDSAKASVVVMPSKIDLSNVFWRTTVADGVEWNFAYVMPDPPGHPLRIMVPSALQMGWFESPANFYAATKTGRNIIAKFVADTALPPHPL
jgi:hypothetical protein